MFSPLTGFYEAIKEDVRISTTHISLYMALLQQWNQMGGGKNPLSIEGTLVMDPAKINAGCAYNKCIIICSNLST